MSRGRPPAASRPQFLPWKPPSKSSGRKARSMLKCLALTLPLCALITGCQTTNKQNACDGFAPLRPKLETTVYILQNDRPFANDVAAHNRLLSSLSCGN
ncbi:hypothetical protein CN106_35925 [Sinorhizobium meliloti]|nr:hypothetical protein CN127_29930 [Sinorhizobium meliloti]RVN54193.1 hypothetical protein CN106_35925 [Sinorhizobium meliloti]